MFYGGFSIDRLSELVPLDGDPLAKRGGVTGRVILACLRQQLPAVLEEGMTLQHDNGPTYRARIVQNWLRIYCRLEGIFMVDQGCRQIRLTIRYINQINQFKSDMKFRQINQFKHKHLYI
jgi:hypothetical protein